MVKPPKYAIRNARKAVECINQGSKAMTEVGLSRMYQLAKGENLTMKDLIEINKFRRHKKNAEYKGNICKDRGAVAWCFTGDTLITLEDGSQKRIEEIVNNKLDVKVLSYNINKKTIESKEIINWQKSNSSINDFTIIGTYKGNRNEFSNKTYIKCTKNHRIFSGGEWIEAKDMYNNDFKYLCNYINKEGQDILIGTILGDGTLSKSSNSGAKLSITHGEKQKDYLMHKAELLRPLGFKLKKQYNNTGFNKFGSYQYNFYTKTLKYLNYLRKEIYKNNVKSFKQIQNLGISDLSLAIWICDDGSLHKNGKNYNYRLHTEGFSKEDIVAIVDFFKSIDIDSKYYKRENCHGYVIYINAMNTKKISKRIAEYVPECMNYKLIPEHREIKKKKITTKRRFILKDEKCVKEEEPLNYDYSYRKPYKWKYKYNIEVKDNNNYFANGILVKNSGWGYGYKNGKPDEKFGNWARRKSRLDK